MATIPIEIILQDAETPVDPTPTPEETNIVVPDTGAGTIGNNTFSSSSVASIIVPAVLLVLSLATVCTLLIHHHKHQGAKASKKEKLATSASATIAVLATTMLVSNLILPATKAATSDTTDTITPSEDKISITVTRDGGVAEESIESKATITSTSDFGYKVLLSMAEGVETSNLYLNGDTSSEYFITSTESTELGDNAWGYALEESGSYSAVPLPDNAATVAEGDEPVEAGILSIYYGVKVGNDLPAGTYSGGEIEYNLVALEPTISTLTYMQDFAKLSESSKASVLRSMTEDQQYYLKDNRDNKTYRIAKLKDGNVWMTQNLDLQKEDLLEGVALDNTNTDSPTDNFVLPASQTNGNESWGDYYKQTDVDALHIYDIAGNGTTYYYCTEYASYGGGFCITYSTDTIPSTELGNYYNWYTATAGTGTYNISDGEVATGSICPAGWRMPNGALSSDIATDYSNLLYSYGILTEPTGGEYDSDKLEDVYVQPLKFIRAGEYNSSAWNSGPVNIVIYNGIWTSMSSTKKTHAIHLQSTHGQISPWEEGGKITGYSVRCLAK